MTAAPLVPLPLWELVIHLAGGRCTCTGHCGSKHAAGRGRCERDHGSFASKHTGPIRLVAAPADPRHLTLPAHRQARLSADELAAWCPMCLDSARARSLREQRTARAQHAPDTALF